MARHVPRHGMIITVVSLLVLLLTAVTPRAVRASTNYDVTGGYIESSTEAGEATPFLLYIVHDFGDTKTLTATVSFPAGTAVDPPQANGGGCNLESFSILGPVLEMVVNVGLGGVSSFPWFI